MRTLRYLYELFADATTDLKEWVSEFAHPRNRW